jgi:outer membrane biosynthesis protein TonB
MMSSLALAALAACGGEKADNTLASDSALGRDLALAQQDSVQPQLQDVPTTPPPAPEAAAPTPAPRPTPRPTRPSPKPAVAPAPAPAPAPKPAAEVSGTVAAGTVLTFAASEKVCSNTTTVGEKFTADLSESVNATNGVTIPSGATGTFEVLEAKTAKNSNDNTALRVRLVSVQFGGKTYPVDGTVQTASTERVRSATKGTDAKKVAGGAILGAIAGQVIGKSTKGTVIGAAAGAAAGTAAAAATANFDTCLNTGSSISVTLDGPVTVRPAPVR